MTIIAIDPGASGGIALSHLGGIRVIPMPKTEGDVLDALRDMDTGDRPLSCFIEEVGGYVGGEQPGSAMFRFGMGVGFLRGVVMALGMKLIPVRPQVWQKMFALGKASGCASKTVWKNKLKAEAQRRFPELKVTLKTCDALLLLEYASTRPECFPKPDATTATP